MKQSQSNQKLMIGAISALITLAVVLVAALVLFLAGGFDNSATVSAGEVDTPQAQRGAVAFQQAAEGMPRTITVVGEGKVSIDPDIARANIGVDIVGDSVEAATGEAEETMTAMLEALEAQGIAEQDIQTAGFNIWLERPYGGGPEPLSLNQAEAETIYHVNNNVTVTIRDLDTVGEVLNAALEAGANNVFGITFSVDDPGELLSEGRELAVNNARARAEELADFSGATAGELVTVSEIIGGSGGFFPNSINRFGGAEMALGGGGPIAPGALELLVQVQVTFTLE